jgi:hypothetical protein
VSPLLQTVVLLSLSNAFMLECPCASMRMLGAVYFMSRGHG